MQIISAERDKKIINRNEFRVVGMSRSGNHAIINWIIQQVEGRFCFLNCVEPKTNPFCTARPLSHDTTYLTNYDEFDLTAEQEGVFSVKDYLMYSYEDCFLGMVCSDEFVSGTSHINGIEGFWGYAKMRLARFRGMTKSTFYLHLKECEFRYNYRNRDIYKILLKHFRSYPLF